MWLIRWTFYLGTPFAVGQLIGLGVAHADAISELPEKVLSQCGLVSALLVVAIIWLAAQHAKTRAGWEADRTKMLEIVRAQNASYDNLAISHAKLEGIVLAFEKKR